LPTEPITEVASGPAVAFRSSLALDGPVSRKTLLRVITLGFALMVLLVVVAAYFGYNQSVSIQDNAKDLVREQLLSSERANALEAKIESESAELLDNLEWILGACFVVALTISALTIWTTNRTFLRLDWQTRELDRVSWHLVEGHERISRRFSHEMHDELGQALTALKAMLRRITSEDLATTKPEMMLVLDEVMRDVRELAQLLRPVILDDLGLEAGLRWLAERFSQRTQIPIQCEATLNRRLPEETETHLFRIAQEALTNMARHSGATHASIRLQAEGDRAVLTVEDDGRGIASDAPGTRSLGIVGMRARARQISGELLVQNRPEGGLRVRIWVPITEPKHDDTAENTNRIG
jgi:signal transduction histidine kinase